jgi:hypothetical protein
MTLIKTGSKGDLVRELQRRLKEMEFDPGPLDGIFGERTNKAVVDFQKYTKLKTDGIVGPITAGALDFGGLLAIPELERRQFKSLVLDNPNYFGNMPDSSYPLVKEIVANTTYEEITCVGFNPNLDMLEATVHVKLPYGYGGGLCSDGTTEYVRFFIDYGDGWGDAGLVAFTAHDLPNIKDCASKPDKPLAYVATLPLEPNRNYCGVPVLPKVRAILSWEAEPPDDNPDWPPVWGNVVDEYIQIKPRQLLVADFVTAISAQINKVLTIPPEFKVFEEQPLPPVGPPTIPLQTLVATYTGKVEPHRFGFSDIQPHMKSGAINVQLIAAKTALWKDLGLDWKGALKALLATSGNVSYEELECVGLDDNRGWLEATFRAKKPSGFSGGLCSAGSWEYVAFWADWNDTCTWTYLGTAKVNVHDISEIPAEGLQYAAILPVNLDALRQECTEPKIGRIRAVLSWNTKPSTTDPNKLPYWGNRLDAHVHIMPGEPGGDQARISILGGVGIADINISTNGMTKALAKMVPWGTFADPWGSHDRECPFGGLVTVHAPPVPGHKYRILVKAFGSTTEIRVTNRILVTNQDGVSSYQYADPVSGFFDYLDVTANILNLLAVWPSSGNGLWEIRLELSADGVTVIDQTPWHRIRLDDTQPSAEINIDGGACDQYTPETPITGTFVACDPHFGHFNLDTLPLSMNPPRPKAVATGQSSGEWQTSVTGDAWELDTTGMPQCGYVVRVRVWDRTIRNSHPGAHNYNRDDKGFCLLEEKTS